MAKVTLTDAQKLKAWNERFHTSIGRHINRRDPEAEYNSQSELAHDIGISKTAMSQIMIGRHDPSLRTFARMCNACNMSVDEVGRLVLQLGGIR